MEIEKVFDVSFDIRVRPPYLSFYNLVFHFHKNAWINLMYLIGN